MERGGIQLTKEIDNSDRRLGGGIDKASVRLKTEPLTPINKQVNKLSLFASPS